jgi:hypothetical protein
MKIIPVSIKYNKTVIPVFINDSRPLRIILDTGMGWDGLIIMNSDLKDSIELINPSEASLGGAGAGNGQEAEVSDSMSFIAGNVEFDNQRIVKLLGDSFKGFPNDGIIGYSIFGHYMVEIDYDRSVLILHEPFEFHADSSMISIPLYFKDSFIPWIDAEITTGKAEPVNISCYIDLASSEYLELLMKPDQKFIVPDTAKEVYLGRGLSGDIYGRKGKIKNLRLGPLNMANVDAAFTPSEIRSKQRGADGVIGGGLLNRFNLIFDYAGNKLYLVPNSRFDFSDEK